MKKLYQHTQTSALLWILSIIIIGVQLIFFLTKDVLEHKTTLITFVIASLVLLVASLIFSRLSICVTQDKIEAAFGFRAFVQSMALEEIDPTKIEVVQAPLMYGIGLRLTPKGTLYNTSHGKSLHITSKDGKKRFFVGTQNAEEIKAILRKELNS